MGDHPVIELLGRNVRVLEPVVGAAIELALRGQLHGLVRVVAVLVGGVHHNDLEGVQTVGVQISLLDEVVQRGGAFQRQGVVVSSVTTIQPVQVVPAAEAVV